MTQEVRGVVASCRGQPGRVETIIVPAPGPGEAVVKIQAGGVCHTDLHYQEGGINDDFPSCSAMRLRASWSRSATA